MLKNRIFSDCEDVKLIEKDRKIVKNLKCRIEIGV